LDKFLLALAVAVFEEGAAMRYGDVRASLERCGRPIGPLDTLIGSHAHELDVILVMHYTREFSRIEGLLLEDWTVTGIIRRRYSVSGAPNVSTRQTAVI
jgi:tRNA(fMet)-specific endonuclease VapC